jgi:hypothetical protein
LLSVPLSSSMFWSLTESIGLLAKLNVITKCSHDRDEALRASTRADQLLTFASRNVSDRDQSRRRSDAYRERVLETTSRVFSEPRARGAMHGKAGVTKRRVDAN